MMRYLYSRQCGTLDPQAFVKVETTRRAHSHQLSIFYDVEKVHTGGINTLDVDLAEGRYLLTGTADSAVAIHDLHNVSGQPKYQFPCVAQITRATRNAHKFSVETVTWYPLDTGMFLTSGSDKLLKIWDANYLQVADEFEFSGLVCSHHMSPVATQHSLIAVGSRSSKVRLLDLKTGAATHTLRGHRHPVLIVRWSPRDEYTLASGGEDCKVHVWDIRSAKGPLMVLNKDSTRARANANPKNQAHEGSVNGLCFTWDGLHLVSYGCDNTLRVWRTSSGRNTTVIHKVYNDSKKAVNFAVSDRCSPDLIYMPAGSMIEVYSLQGRHVAQLSGHYNPVHCVHFDTQEHNLYSGGNDRNLLIWTPETEAVISYKEHVDEMSGVKKVHKNGTDAAGTLGTEDAWSSDENGDAPANGRQTHGTADAWSSDDEG